MQVEWVYQLPRGCLSGQGLGLRSLLSPKVLGSKPLTCYQLRRSQSIWSFNCAPRKWALGLDPKISRGARKMLQTHGYNSPLETDLQGEGTQELMYTGPSPYLGDVRH